MSYFQTLHGRKIQTNASGYATTTELLITGWDI